MEPEWLLDLPEACLRRWTFISVKLCCFGYVHIITTFIRTASTSPFYCHFLTHLF